MHTEVKAVDGGGCVRGYRRILERLPATRPSESRLKLANAVQEPLVRSADRPPGVPDADPGAAPADAVRRLPFPPEERRVFLDACSQAHLRGIALAVPDPGDPGRDTTIDEMVADLAGEPGHMAQIVRFQTDDESKP